MGYFLVLVSLVLMIKGIMLIMAPKKVVKWAASLLKSKEPRLWGLVPLLVGILLLFCASASALGWLIVLLGLGEIAKAVYVFLTPLQKLQSHWYFRMSDNGSRGLGILILILGVIVYLSRL